MATARTAALPRRPASGFRRFWDDAGRRIVNFLVRLGRQAVGLSFLGAAAIAGLALATWHAADPSFNNATAAAPQNVFGLTGAFAADTAWQVLGLAAGFVPLPFAVWGLALMLGPVALRLPSRLIAVVIATPLLAIGLGAIPAAPDWPFGASYGGLLGTLARTVFDSLAAAAGAGEAAPLAGAAAAIAFGAGGVIAALAALMLTPGRIARGIAALTRLRAPAFAFPAFTLPRIAMPGVAAAGSRGRRHRIADDDDDGDDDDGIADDDDAGNDAAPAPRARREPSLFAKPEPRVQKPAKRKESKRAAGERQAALDLEPGRFQLPPLSLLRPPPKDQGLTALSEDALESNARMLEGVLGDFGVRGQITSVKPGPVVTLYELEPAPGIKASRVIGLADDIARNMSAVSCRVAAVPGRNVLGIELPNAKRETVFLRELLSSPEYEATSSALTLALGKTIGGEPVPVDLAKMPHLLVAGTTGSGKSVAINTMVLSLLYRLTPEQCRLIMIDPKMLELSMYEGIPHLLAPVVTEPKKAVVALKWTVREMEDRYRKMAKLNVRNIQGFNERVAKAAEKGEMLKRRVQTGYDRETGQPVYEEETLALEPLPYIVVIVDEVADLMLVAGKEIEGLVQRLAQMARAAGIHLIAATQRPSVDVITGTIKANFPARISFQVTSKIDSRTILGEQGAEQLLGQGDMLYMAPGGRIRRVHGPFVSDDEVEAAVQFLKAQGAPDYLDAVTEDPDEDGEGAIEGLDGEGGGSGDALYDQAVAIVARERKASTSYIQRRLMIGYNRAARLIEKMEEEGVVSRPNHQGKREVLVGDHSA